MGGQGGAEESAWGGCEELASICSKEKNIDLHKEKQPGWGEGLEFLSLKM